MSRKSPAGRITVECPACGNRFDTHDVGDLAVCEECEVPFNRFTNIVDDGEGR